MPRRTPPITTAEATFMLSARVPIALNKRLDVIATTMKRSRQSIVIAALTVELDILETVLAERDAFENRVRAQSKRNRIQTHTQRDMSQNQGSAKRIPKNS